MNVELISLEVFINHLLIGLSGDMFTRIFPCFFFFFFHLWVLHVYNILLKLVMISELYCPYFMASLLWSNIPAIPIKIYPRLFFPFHKCSGLFKTSFVLPLGRNYHIPYPFRKCFRVQKQLEKKIFQELFWALHRFTRNSQHIRITNSYVSRMLFSGHIFLRVLDPQGKSIQCTICSLIHIYLVMFIWISPSLILIWIFIWIFQYNNLSIVV